MPGTITLDPLAQLPGVAVVTIAHPGRLGAMTRAMWLSLREVFEAVQRDAAWRCVVVRGEGGAFCAGGDISEYPSFRFQQASLRQFHEEDVWGGLQAMLNCDVPLLAQIDGACMGAGVEIAACCDIRVAARGAKFGAPIAKLGFPMAPREAQLVARVLGDATARDMLLAASVFDAEQMAARGFLSQVLPAQEVAPHVLTVAQRIAALAPLAARLNKQTLRALQPPLDEDLHAYDYASSAEHQEGITAFLAKRPVAF
ncbi:enoyl-CoA hydratase/isomerase family protein [Variovorax sp. HJSM1_2]|uniref:enoyl-CoA hydratase/isomerase family protein n=1 Tax=Variovorax sp. HJSM1_2 TaxID=3366263 RepID=UPI003BD25696